MTTLSLVLAVFAVTLGAPFLTPLVTPERGSPTEESFRKEVEKIGLDTGCNPKDFIPDGEYRVVVFICKGNEPPEVVLFNGESGRWVGHRAIYPDFSVPGTEI